MPITENNFTAEEFSAALTANPALVDLVTGFTTSETNKEHPLVKKLVPAIASPLTSQHAQTVEKDVLELTGIPKLNAEEKYYDYQKRAFKQKFGNVEQMQTEIADLKKKSTEGLTQAERDKLAALELALSKKDTEWGDRVKQKDEEIFKLKTGTELEKALNKYRGNYKKDLPPTLITLAEEAAKNALAVQAVIQDNGQITYKDKEGKIILNKSTFQPAVAEDLIAPLLTDLIDTGKKQGGTGSNENTAGAGAGGEKGKFVSLPATVKTQLALTDYLLQLGYTDDDPEFTRLMAEQGSKLPLR